MYKLAKRTHEVYVKIEYEDHHTVNVSKLKELPGIDLLRLVPLNCMHLVCIGIVKKLVFLWLG